jgi:hypothetical protein
VFKSSTQNQAEPGTVIGCEGERIRYTVTYIKLYLKRMGRQPDRSERIDRKYVESRDTFKKLIRYCKTDSDITLIQ